MNLLPKQVDKYDPGVNLGEAVLSGKLTAENVLFHTKTLVELDNRYIAVRMPLRDCGTD